MPLETAYQLLQTLAFIILYGFLIVVLWIIWQDIKSTRELIDLSQSAKSILLDTNNNLSHNVSSFTSIGRSSSNTIILYDATVSMTHALITRRDATWWLEDLKSRNHTYLNSQQVEGPTVISSGDLITIGSYNFSFKE
ncbi:MAG: hypothetical protein CL789_03525 [Chloroflexi bacterium]|nr:hypothetical protein [Chloroflexota bacterium]